VDDGFDLALRIGNLSDSSLIARKLCDIGVIHVASTDYIKARGMPMHWHELSEHECILDTNFRDPFIWPFIDKNNVIEEYSVNGRLKFSNAEVCLKAACAGLGIARLPMFVAADALREKAVVPVLASCKLPILGLYALYPPAKHLARKSRVVIDFLVDALSGQPAWEQGW
jgi:DNA-binding transcriptional LysR family regulator